mmetsp:Transcript_21801/g.54539  ORF Transcript_21801/g.54539 Transcript_21801/m.54539 type:complete len:229 (-) Transcript_21801:63-749(-)|eukprot:CAMPEP_0115279578 /NCGR_PEP_ID=MMETSP0270-20121206/58334_1 /TAXON_ID=71861 /ORGANISM="Scrippsiella trochoidea, Strain CCMP3099" /LENGTH=228 /DNA_ID=CAMNT_0002696267 /DNA_START=57 /DNA_END=743 /DNA_ORIENTATION=+
MASMVLRLVGILAAAAACPALSDPEVAGIANATAGPSEALLQGPASREGASKDAADEAGGEAPRAATVDARQQAVDAAALEATHASAVDATEQAVDEVPLDAAAASAANATAQAKLDLAALAALAESSVSLRGASGWWGHGTAGETCCMCSRHVGWTTVLYAAEDYSNKHGFYNAQSRCQNECEEECHDKGGHKFGCYDEQHLVWMDRVYGHRANYQILHDDHYGDIC